MIKINVDIMIPKECTEMCKFSERVSNFKGFCNLFDKHIDWLGGQGVYSKYERCNECKELCEKQ